MYATCDCVCCVVAALPSLHDDFPRHFAQIYALVPYIWYILARYLSRAALPVCRHCKKSLGEKKKFRRRGSNRGRQVGWAPPCRMVHFSSFHESLFFQLKVVIFNQKPFSNVRKNTKNCFPVPGGQIQPENCTIVGENVCKMLGERKLAKI